MPVVGIPAPKQAGTYYLLACADGNASFEEIGETNNCLAAPDAVVVERSPRRAHVSGIVSFPTHLAAGSPFSLTLRVHQPSHSGRRAVGIFLGTRSSAGGRLTRVGSLSAPGNGGGVARSVRVVGRLRLGRRATRNHVRFLVACLGRPRAGGCLVAARPLFVTPR
jgi:hypothetical protein